MGGRLLVSEPKGLGILILFVFRFSDTIGTGKYIRGDSHSCDSAQSIHIISTSSFAATIDEANSYSTPPGSFAFSWRSQLPQADVADKSSFFGEFALF